MGRSKPIPRNWNYSMNKTKGADHIAPAKVFDDGLFTYLEYPRNRPIPAFFVVDSTGQESRVVPHMDGDLAVIERLAKQIILRRGKAVVGIWNDSYDFDGVSAENGVTVRGFERRLR
ncbi:MAG: TrbG/VirB9 family P-type conjugative transfer protein [Pseudomonadales bacterium]